MIIGIDGNEANLSERVGVGQYAFNLLTELSLLGSSNQYHIFLKNQPQQDMPKSSDNWHYHVFGPGKLWTRIALPIYLKTRSPKLDLFYSPSHYSPLFSPYKTIPTIHDLGYLDNLEQFTKKDIHQLVNWTKYSLDHAHHIIAVSNFTKHELIRIYQIHPDKISVVYNGVGEPPQIVAPYITPPYFVAVGTLKPNKNLSFLISAFAKFLKLQSSKDLKLVIAGKKGWLFNDIFQTVLNEDIESSVIFTDYITEAQKWSLYKHAIATVIPSTYEGFGIPAIESQKMGTPVIASDIPALKEVLENSAIFIDPYQIDSLVKAMSDVENPSIRQQLITDGLIQSQKFTWTNSARSLQTLFYTLT